MTRDELDDVVFTAMANGHDPYSKVIWRDLRCRECGAIRNSPL
jgi:hypothetical protein